jgi:hypothetical protein
MLPETPRAARSNCRQRYPPLTGGTYHAETARRACMRDHYGAATEGPRRPVTTAPTSSTMPVAAPPEKACPLCTTTARTAVLMVRFLTK